MEVEGYHFGFDLVSAIVKLNAIAITGGCGEAFCGWKVIEKSRRKRSSQGILG